MSVDSDPNQNAVLGLRSGEKVEVRSESEILATLDGHDALEGLPFMPEMRKYCGRRFSIFRRVDRMFVEEVGNRSSKSTVVLEGATCDGRAHKDCRRTCFLLWKEAWLKRVDDSLVQDSTSDYGKRKDVSPNEADIRTRKKVIVPCQLALLTQATNPLIISPEDLVRQHLCDSKLGKIYPVKLICRFLLWLNFKIQRTLGRKKYATIRGKLKRTPTASLKLQPGELVQVKDRDEILSTLDIIGRNRGLSFTAEMQKYCGKRYRVLKRVDKMVVETGEMRSITNTVLLEDVNCDGSDHDNCPRYCYCLWREIWLRRV